MKTRSQTSWPIDTALFAGFIAAFFPDVTGVEHHQWIGILGGGLAVYHLASQGLGGSRCPAVLRANLEHVPSVSAD